MSDVLKQVEEALEPFASFSAYLNAHPRIGIGDVLYGWDNADEASLRQRDLRAAAAALAALRGLAWKPLEEMEEKGVQVVCGKWMKRGGKWQWITCDGWVNKKAAQMSGYTHFCRPILPSPPKREGQNAVPSNH